jgi:CubicO group peptidase (beta-lactamase class C family)
MKKLVLFLFVFSCLSCGSDDDDQLNNPVDEAMYFPPITGTTWENKNSTDLGWNTSQIQQLKDYLAATNTKSFMILVNGRIVMEEYLGSHTATSSWQWNSAGKTLTTAMTGIAQQEGLLSLTDKVSDYINTGWTTAPLNKENLINCRHLITMTSGIDDEVGEMTTPSNLPYKADAGARWAYHNIFQKQMDVIAAASNSTFDSYFTNKLKNKIGMDGTWNNGSIYRIYSSSTRSMARFGLLALNKGKWNGETIINETFFNESISSSQNINPSYGYMWWLNGKSSYMIPNSQQVFQGSLVPNAPADMYAAMGASDQRIYVIPSKKMVIIRMGEASNPSNPSFAVSGFDNTLWEKLNLIFN